MMKKIFSIAIMFAAAAVVLTGCKNEEEDLFPSSAAERLIISQTTYKQRLGGTTWAMEFYPLPESNFDNASNAWEPTGLGYLIMNRFKADGSVEQAMNNDLCSNTYLNDVSMWEIVTDQGPVLSFNTFNKCIHLFSDPGLYDQGLGYEGDYEFEVLNLEENAKHSMLKGKKRGVYVRMTRVPDDTNFKDYLDDVIAFQNKMFSAAAPNYCVMTIAGKKFKMEELSLTIPNIYPYDGDAISDESRHPYIVLKYDDKYYLRFRDAIDLVSGLKQNPQEFVYDPEGDIFRCVSNSEYTIAGPNANMFYGEAMQAGHKWQLTRGSVMSESFKAIYEAMYESFRKYSSKYSLQNVQFSVITDEKSENKGKMKLDITYTVKSTTGTSTAHFVVNYDLAYNEESATISNRELQGNAQTIMNNIKGIEPFLNAIEGTFHAAAGTTLFDMRSVKMTSATDTNANFVLTFIN